MKDFYRVKQLSWLKMKPFPNFESSTHSVGEKWPIEFYAQTYPLANQIYVYTPPGIVTKLYQPLYIISINTFYKR